MNNLAGNRNDIWILTKNAREFPVNTKEPFSRIDMLHLIAFDFPDCCSCILLFIHHAVMLSL